MYKIKAEMAVSRETLEELGGSVEVIMTLRERLLAAGISITEVFGQEDNSTVTPLDGDAVKQVLHGELRTIAFWTYDDVCVTYTVKELVEFRNRQHKEDSRYCLKKKGDIVWGLDDAEVAEALLMHEEILSLAEIELLGFILEVQEQGEGEGMDVWSEGALRSRYSDFVRYRAGVEEVKLSVIKSRCFDTGLSWLRGTKK